MRQEKHGQGHGGLQVFAEDLCQQLSSYPKAAWTWSGRAWTRHVQAVWSDLLTLPDLQEYMAVLQSSAFKDASGWPYSKVQGQGAS